MDLAWKRFEILDARRRMPDARYQMPDGRYEGLDEINLPTTNSKLPTELVAQDIRQGMYYLGEITGEIRTEDVMGNIFGRLCIGK